MVNKGLALSRFATESLRHRALRALPAHRNGTVRAIDKI
jgi:hypothetical protein